MLTSDLLRASFKEGCIRPSYVSTTSDKQLERAGELIEAFQAHVGRQRGDLDESIAHLIGDATQHKLIKGLVKLLLDRSDFESDSPIEPMQLRRQLFRRAAERGPVLRRDSLAAGTPRAAIVAEVAQELGVEPDVIEKALFADLKDQAWLRSFDTLEPEALLQRYNTALAQAVLLRAHHVRIHTNEPDPKRWRALFRAVKFHGLSYRVKQAEAGYILELDGPLSLFRLSTKYGLKLANFLPVLLHAENWKLEADVEWSGRKRTVRFELDPEQGLQSHVRERGLWVSDEEKWFIERLTEKVSPWSVDTKAKVITVSSGEVVVPDLVLRHEDGRIALVEIIWFWRKASLEPRVKSLKKGAPKNLILALSDRLRGSKEDLENLPIPTLRFKGVLPVTKLLQLADEVAR